MTTSADLGIPFIVGGQGQPEVTHNEALLLLQAISKGVIDRGVNTPAVGPTIGDSYIIGSSPTGVWAGRANCITIYSGTAWDFIPGENSSGTPLTMGARQEGLGVWVNDENVRYVWDGSAWTIPTVFNTVNLTGGKIAFPAVQIPSSDVNTLDDYEEGTWTPVLTFATPGDLSVTYANQAGFYTKIGREVILRFAMSTATFTHSTASGNLQITGLPFTSSSTTGAVSEGALRWSGINKASYTDCYVTIGLGVTLLGIGTAGMGQVAASVMATDMPSGGTVLLFGQVTYMT